MPEHLTNTYPVNITPPTKASGGPPLHEAGRAGLSKTRLAMAFLVAATSDVVSFGTEVVPPVQWTVDFVTALLLFMILGWRWALLPGFVAEGLCCINRPEAALPPCIPLSADRRGLRPTQFPHPIEQSARDRRFPLLRLVPLCP
jgi:hypothetical protein